MSNFVHCIITRFSFRFRAENDSTKLLAPDRLIERIRLFKEVCFPSIINQTEKKFYWILIIDPLLPEEFRQKLKKLINKSHLQGSHYANKGPRGIFLWEWDWSKWHLGKADWVLTCLKENIPGFQSPKQLITTRLDDDDALRTSFISQVHKYYQKWIKMSSSPKFKYLTFVRGYFFDTNAISLRPKNAPLIAIGLTLMTQLDKYPITAYLGNHTRIGLYVRNANKQPKIMRELYEKNNDLPINHKQVGKRLEVIKISQPMWVRTIHDFNLQPNIQHFRNRGQKQQTVRELLRKDFHIVVAEKSDQNQRNKLRITRTFSNSTRKSKIS